MAENRETECRQVDTSRYIMRNYADKAYSCDYCEIQGEDPRICNKCIKRNLARDMYNSAY